MQPIKQDLAVVPGTTYRDTVRLMQPAFEYRAVTAVTGAPARISVPGHGLTHSWPVWLRGVTGLQAVNRDPVREPPWRADVIDADTLELNALSADAAPGRGGQLIYRRPIDLTGCTVRMRIGALELTDGAGLTVQPGGTVERELTPAQTAVLEPGWRYTFEVEFSDGSITRFFEGGAATEGCGHGC